MGIPSTLHRGKTATGKGKKEQKEQKKKRMEMGDTDTIQNETYLNISRQGYTQKEKPENEKRKRSGHTLYVTLRGNGKSGKKRGKG